MRRKVIQIADSTQLVSLPRKWSVAQDIKKGDELEVREEGSRLIVTTLNAPEKGGIEVEITGMDRDSLMFFVRSLYKIGYDEIKLTFKNPKVENIRKKKEENILDVISKEVSRLTGMEIFSHKQNLCVLTSISEDSIKAFDSILRRIFILSEETINDLADGYKKADTHLLEGIQSKHDAITRLVVYSQRLLNKLGHPNYEKKDIYYHILELFDELLDIIKYNARELLKVPFKPSKEGKDVYAEFAKAFDSFYRLFYNFKTEKIAEINQQRYDIINLMQKGLKKIHKSEIILMTHIEQASEKIINLTVSTMSLQY